MSELSRHLKKKNLAVFLEQAQRHQLALTDYLAVVDDDGRELGCVGTPLSEMTCITLPLNIEGRHAGELRGCSQYDMGRFEFFRFTLQALIDSEHACRTVSEETLEQYRELSLLHRAAVSLNASLDLRKVARALLDLLHEGHEEAATVGACYAYTGAQNELLPLAAFHSDDDTLDALAAHPLIGAIAAGGKAEIINDLAKNPRWQGNTRYQHVLAVPIVASEVVVGLLLLATCRDEAEFHASDLKRATTLASMAAGALRNARLFEEVTEVKNYNESVLKSLSNGVIALDRTGVISKVNRATCQILSLTEVEIVGQTLTKLLGAHNAWLENAVRNVCACGEAEIHLDRELCLPGRMAVNLNLTLEPLLDVTEHPIGTMLVMEDITHEKRIKNTMSRFMPDQVVDKLLAGDDSFLGGKEQPVSVLFSDIRRFTSMSENLSPADAVGKLNEYFAGMVDIIFEHRGTLDKFIGDGIMALFGAPFVSAQDADNAVDAAVAMMRNLSLFNAKCRKQGSTPFNIGIGINSGPVIVGNIGSPKRMDFTVIGDHVNLASRLESANKFYGSKILISEYTRQNLSRPHAIREIDKVRVVGRRQAVRIFEVLDYHSETDFPRLEHVLLRFSEGLADFRARHFKNAAKAFGEVVQIKPDDKPSVIYLQRCLEYGEREPPADWDGVENLYAK
jgi:adenylate cyclase